ncbi:MAG: pantetheine-phosphate adenylyltransferase [Clostridia bacterium]|nr:pantetheine-phosphate adenylyltransferase [Clostridia bacterium]
MRLALIPGSFDPMTLGHLDLVRRSLKLFDAVAVAIMCNPDKKYLFTDGERRNIALLTVAGMPGVTVISCDGYTADLAAAVGACALVKGIRSDADLRDEYAQYEFNSQRQPGIETVLLPAAPDMAEVSSTAVRKLILSGSDTSAFLAPEAARYIAGIIKNR